MMMMIVVAVIAAAVFFLYESIDVDRFVSSTHNANSGNNIHSCQICDLILRTPRTIQYRSDNISCCTTKYHL